MEYPKLELELKKKWIDALRSGEYVQAEGVLYDATMSDAEGKPACCCLGVLEHICGTSFTQMEDSENTFPQDLDNPNAPSFLLGGRGTTDPGDILASMNDGNTTLKVKKHSFEEIAQWIDTNL